ncbi:helix-turn-helix domain-containing protein [Clostridium sp. E02]|uniref:helix-turn-helix domain-containing protein n=1 Tax=Clostridium sp. E02 TaxID=2487134 RepID=UPI0013DDD30D|nr:helix-turn-helix domain-containing protein [Clostridium sp. E02]
MNIKTLERELGIENGTIRRWDERSPQCDKIVRVAEYLHVSLDWLILGKEVSDGFTVEEHNIIQAYRKVDFIDQESIKRTLKVKQSEKSLDASKSQGK